MRKSTILALLIIAAVFTLWRQEDVKIEPDADPETGSRFPDYFMENFSITSMNKQGEPAHILKAKKMLHYSDEDYSELEQPFITFSDANSHFTIQAEKANFKKNQNIIYLHKNVIIQRAASKNQNELFIYTDYLKIDTQTRIAETDQAARVKTNKAELNTKGLIFDNMKGILKLQSQVKGIYETAR